MIPLVVVMMCDPARDLARGVCTFCKRKVGPRGFLELYSHDGEGRLDPPGFGSPVALLSHATCGPDTGYPIALARLAREPVEGRYGLVEHIEAKTWACPAYTSAIRIAAKRARKLARRKRRKR